MKQKTVAWSRHENKIITHLSLLIEDSIEGAGIILLSGCFMVSECLHLKMIPLSKTKAYL